MTQQDDSLRKAAVLIAALDDEAAEALLEQIGCDHGARLRNMLAGTASISPHERAQVLQEFLQAAQAGRPAADDDGVEVDDSLAAQFAAVDRLAASPPAAPTEPPPGSLAPQPGPPPADLGQLPAGEQLRAVSLLLSQLPAEAAAELLGQLIAQAAPAPERQMLPAAEEHNADLPRQLGGRSLPPAMREASFTDRSHRPGFPLPTRPPAAHRGAASAPQPKVDFHELIELDDYSLAELFRRADPQVALLALTGAPPLLVERICRQLPWREARDLKRQMGRLGPLRLSDVEFAQQQLAALAGRLIHEGTLRPSNRRFTMAA